MIKGKNSSYLKSSKVVAGGLISVILSLACMWAVVKFTGGKGLMGHLMAVGLSTLVLSLLLVVGSWIADALRLWVLASAMGGSVQFLQALKMTVMGSFMAGITPFDTGGEPLKVYFLHKQGLSVGTATAAVALGSFLNSTSRFGLWALMPLTIMLTGARLNLSFAVRTALFVSISVYIIFLGLIAAVMLWPEWLEMLVRRMFGLRLLKNLVSESTLSVILEKVRISAFDFREGVRKVKSNGGYALIAALLSVVYWVFIISVPALIVRRMSPTVSYPQVFFMGMTLYLVMAYIPTPGSSGGAEVGSAYLFASMLPSKLLGGFVVVWRFVTFYFTLLVGGGVLAFETISVSSKRSVHR